MCGWWDLYWDEATQTTLTRATTDQASFFRAAIPPQGPYSSPQYLPYWGLPRPLDLAACGPSGLNVYTQSDQYHCTAQSQPMLIVANRGGIEGTVRLDDGSAAPSALVCVYDVESPTSVADARVADAGGQFSFNGSSELEHQNNWGVSVNYPTAPGELGHKTYRVVASADATGYDCPAYDAPGWVEVDVSSSHMSEANPRIVSIAPREMTMRSCPSTGEPVSLATGNVFLDQMDIMIPGRGPGLRLVRSYNSLNAMKEGAFGLGWTMSYEKRIDVAGTLLLLREGDGVPMKFTDSSGAGTFDVALPFSRESWFTRDGTTYTRHFRLGASESYDAQGRLTTIEDPSGNQVTLTRDAAGRLTSMADPGGRTLEFAYAGSHVTSLSGPDGLIARYAYSGSLLQSVTYPDGSGYSFAYDDRNQLLRIVDHSGVVLESHTYVGDQAVTSEKSAGQERYSIAYGDSQATVTDALGNVSVYEWASIAGLSRPTRVTGQCSCGSGSVVQEWTYDAEGRVLTYKDGSGSTTTYGYDANGDLISTTDPLNLTTTSVRDSSGRLVSQTDPLGAVRSWTYGPAGPLTVTDPRERVTTISYDNHGQLQSIASPGQGTALYEHDAAGNLTSITDPLGSATHYGYDALGRRTTVRDAQSNTTTTHYDARGRVSQVVRPDGSHSDSSYDLGGRLTSHTDALGAVTRYFYDGVGRLQAVSDALYGRTSYGYDAMSHVTSLTDALGNATRFEYDSYGRTERIQHPGGGAESFTYDGVGRPLTKTDRRGTTTTFSYDAAGRLLQKAYSDTTPAVTFAYDHAGRLTTATNAAESIVRTYDLAGALVWETSARNGQVVGSEYDAGGRRMNLKVGPDTSQTAVVASYEYDGGARLSKTTGGGVSFTFGYDTLNRRTSLLFSNGIGTGYTYDALGQLIRISAPGVSDTVYTYDAVGRRTSKTTGDRSEKYAYDELSRLTSVNHGVGEDAVFVYDAVGNRRVAQDGQVVTTAVFNAENELVSQVAGGRLRFIGRLSEPGATTIGGVPAQVLPDGTFKADGDVVAGTNDVAVAARDSSGNVRTATYRVTVPPSAVSYEYDANGNLTSKNDGVETWTYEWSVENQLTRVLKNGVETARFVYDALGRRVEKTAGGVTSTFLYDGEAILRENRSDGTLNTYIHGPGIDEPLARVGQGGLVEFYRADGLGSIVAMTDAAGNVTSRRQYDAWGKLEQGADQPGYAFTGREWDPETGLYYYRARYYDPALGRFISEDPMGLRGGDANLYGYVGNDPTNVKDPLGLFALRKHVEVYTSLGTCQSPYGCLDAQQRLTIRCDKCGMMNIDLEVNAVVRVKPGDYGTPPLWFAPADRTVVDERTAIAHELRHLEDRLNMAKAYLLPKEHKYGSEGECLAAKEEIEKVFPILWNSVFHDATTQWQDSPWPSATGL